MLWFKSLHLSSHKNAIRLIKHDKLYFFTLYLSFTWSVSSFVLLRLE